MNWKSSTGLAAGLFVLTLSMTVAAPASASRTGLGSPEANSAGVDAPARAAANPTKRCQANPGEVQPTCILYFYNFPGGTMSIDVDADGTGTGHWNLLHQGAWTGCHLYYNLQDPPQSWICNNLPAGNYVLRNDAQLNTTFHQLGTRW